MKTTEDLPFRHYTLKHRLIAWVGGTLFDTMIYRVRHGLLKGMWRRGGFGWVPWAPMTAEQRFWGALYIHGMTIYDIGAFHGLLTLLFASRAREVVSFEPNSRNYERLTDNLLLNHVSNVQVLKIGIGSRNEKLMMVGSPLMSGGASVDGKTVTGLLRAGVVIVESIPVFALDGLVGVGGLPAPDLIKIDIEGWELEALRGARQTLQMYQPALFIEVHGETIRDKKRRVMEVVTFLWEMRYRIILHIESGVLITPHNSEVAMQGHIYAVAEEG